MKHLLKASVLSVIGTLISSHVFAASGTAPHSIYAAWSQITGSQATHGYTDLHLSLRFVVETGNSGASCPDFNGIVAHNGATTLHKLTFTKRTNNPDGPGIAPDAQKFPLIVCQADAPTVPGTLTLVANDAAATPVTFSNSQDKVVTLPLAANVGQAGPPTFVALGDTGCRGKHNNRGKQDCDPATQSTTKLTQFRFHDIADKAAKLNPDFIVHLGDYRYQKEYNRTFDMWDSDFFDRVRLGLLHGVPWAFVRGNHEECSLAGKGWFFFFAPGDGTTTCSTTSSYIGKTWYFDVADRSNGMANPHRFVVIDTSPTVHHHNKTLRNRAIKEMSAAITAAQTPGWSGGAMPSSWFLMHKPLWAADDYPNPPEQADHRTGDVLRAAMAMSGSADCTSYEASKCGLKAILAAHLHILQNMVTTGLALPQQYIVGNSGVRMDHAVAPQGCILPLDPLGFGTDTQTGVVLDIRGRRTYIDNDSFGFAHFARDPNAGQSGWAASAYYMASSAAVTLSAGKTVSATGRVKCLHQ